MLQGYFAEFLQLYSSITFIYSTYLLVSDLIRLLYCKALYKRNFTTTKIFLGLGIIRLLYALLKRGLRFMFLTHFVDYKHKRHYSNTHQTYGFRHFFRGRIDHFSFP